MIIKNTSEIDAIVEKKALCRALFPKECRFT